MPFYLEYVPPATWGHMRLPHDGATQNFGRDVTTFLKEKNERRRIRTDGPVSWPARSPEFSPLDWFLLGCLKSTFYHSGKPEGSHQLGEAMNLAAGGIGTNWYACSGKFSGTTTASMQIWYLEFWTCLTITFKLQCDCRLLTRWR
jgi:hypothetical protein